MKRLVILVAAVAALIFLISTRAVADGIAIGNADYNAPGYSDLPKDRNDAFDMAKAFRVMTHLKIDRTQPQMRGDVSGLQCGDDNLKIVYVSSHGTDGPPLGLAGVNGGVYTADQLAADLNCSLCLTVVILDACYSGGMIQPAGDSCCTFLTACADTECTQALKAQRKDERNSLFTEYVLRGVRGDADANNDDQVTLGELHDYLTTNYDPLYSDINHQYNGDEKGTGHLVIFKDVSQFQIPTLTQWGIIILVVLIVFSTWAVLRRRKAAVSPQ